METKEKLYRVYAGREELPREVNRIQGMATIRQLLVNTVLARTLLRTHPHTPPIAAESTALQ